MTKRRWQVLLVGGNSGAGKSTIAPALARQFDVPWFQVDDLRLTLEWNTSPEDYPALHLFDDLPTVYQHTAENIVEWRIAMAVATAHAIEIVIANHVENAGPIILEGDDLTPAFATQRAYTGREVAEGAVRAVFIIESDESAIEANMHARGRSFSDRPPIHQRTMVRVSSLYGAWLRREAEHLGLPVVASRPYSTLLRRLLVVSR